MKEAHGARFFGTEYVIAGRMVRMITDLRIAAIHEEDWSATLPLSNTELSMKLWSIRNYIVENYRRLPTVVNFSSWRRR